MTARNGTRPRREHESLDAYLAREPSAREVRIRQHQAENASTVGVDAKKQALLSGARRHTPVADSPGVAQHQTKIENVQAEQEDELDKLATITANLGRQANFMHRELSEHGANLIQPMADELEEVAGRLDTVNGAVSRLLQTKDAGQLRWFFRVALLLVLLTCLTLWAYVH